MWNEKDKNRLGFSEPKTLSSCEHISIKLNTIFSIVCRIDSFFLIFSLNRKAMRDPRGVDRISASYDMPAVTKDHKKSGGDLENGIGISYDTNTSTTVECVSEKGAIVLVSTGDTMPIEATINLDLDDDENENEPEVKETEKSAKVDNAPIDEVEQKRKVNGENSSTTESDDKFNVDVSPRNDTSEKPPELMNGIEYNSDDVVNNKLRSSIESLAADDNGEVESNDQRSSKATATAAKSKKRKISISSEDEQPPPAKK